MLFNELYNQFEDGLRAVANQKINGAFAPIEEVFSKIPKEEILQVWRDHPLEAGIINADFYGDKICFQSNSLMDSKKIYKKWEYSISKNEAVYELLKFLDKITEDTYKSSFQRLQFSPDGIEAYIYMRPIKPSEGKIIFEELITFFNKLDSKINASRTKENTVLIIKKQN